MKPSDRIIDLFTQYNKQGFKEPLAQAIKDYLDEQAEKEGV